MKFRLMGASVVACALSLSMGVGSAFAASTGSGEPTAASGASVTEGTADLPSDSEITQKVAEGAEIFFTKVLFTDGAGSWAVDPEGAAKYAPQVSLSDLQRLADVMNKTGSSSSSINVAPPLLPQGAARPMGLMSFSGGMDYTSCVVASVLGIPLSPKDGRKIGAAIATGNPSKIYNSIADVVKSDLVNKIYTTGTKIYLKSFLNAEPAGLIANIAVSLVSCAWD